MHACACFIYSCWNNTGFYVTICLKARSWAPVAFSAFLGESESDSAAPAAGTKGPLLVSSLLNFTFPLVACARILRTQAADGVDDCLEKSAEDFNGSKHS